MNYIEFFNDLKTLISFKSVQGEAKDGAPFGEENRRALEFFLKKANDFGFKTINYDNYGGEVVYGDGEEIGIVGHLDVVPVGQGWNTDPFTLTEVDGWLVGRGTEDNKTPCLLCLYALKELKDEGIKFNKKIRFIAGCNEETGWKDIEYIKTKTKFPKYGFSPDSEFPLSYAEKGIYHVVITLPKFRKFKNLQGGVAVNAVCDYASVEIVEDALDCAVNKDLLEKYGLKLKGNLIESFGLSAHGSAPHKGVNALYPLVRYMEEMGEDIQGVAEKLFGGVLNLSAYRTEQGETTLSPDLIKNEDGKYTLWCDLRLPAPLEINKILPLLDKIGLEYQVIEKHEPFMVEKEGFLVSALTSAYNEVTGKTAEPVASGGSTFARCFEKGCAFGPGDSLGTRGCHEANEGISKKHLLECFEIYKKAIYNLVK